MEPKTSRNICTDCPRSEHAALEAEYLEYAEECNAAIRLTLARIENLIQLQNNPARNIIKYPKSRIKTFESTIGKCIDRGYDLDIETIKEKVRDVAGIRIVTTFLDDVYIVMDMLEHIPGVNVTRKKDYIANPKESGYRSLHLEIQVEIYCPKGGSKLVPVEVQIRDKSMDYWATVEHKINYKNENSNAETTAKLKALADYLAESARMTQELANEQIKNPPN